jgi:Maltogenic Amylase, C-terminal domain
MQSSESCFDHGHLVRNCDAMLLQRAHGADRDQVTGGEDRIEADLSRHQLAREGSVVMLDQHNPSVLSYARVTAAGKAVLVALNMSGEPQTIALDLNATGIKASGATTLLSSPDPMPAVTNLQAIQLAPFAAWVASVR